MSRATFLTRVVLENYKSIAACDVRLGPLMFLVGPNGGGKTNFLDSLSFISDALNGSLPKALESRGGGADICYAPKIREGTFKVSLEFALPSGEHVSYVVRIGQPAESRGGRWEVIAEDCAVLSPGPGAGTTFFTRRRDKVSSSANFTNLPIILGERLLLPDAAGRPVFRPVYEALSRMLFYQIKADAISAVETFNPVGFLSSDGGNLASVLFRLGIPPGRLTQERINDYLRLVLPGLVQARVASVLKEQEQVTFESQKIALLFEQRLAQQGVHLFWPAQMSHGTLRALGILTALLQATAQEGPRPSLVAIEEPELHVHPGVLGVLRDAMVETSYSAQVLVTTQSADLLDDKEVSTDFILAVSAEQGQTRIGPIDEASRSVIRERLFTVGQLLRANQLAPEPQTDGGLPSLPPVTQGETG